MRHSLNRTGPVEHTAWQEKLTPLQYAVTQEKQTEPPFSSSYWNLEEPGLYVDIISGEPLFVSRDKVNSSQGWPVFQRPIMSASVRHVSQPDRTEVFGRESYTYLGVKQDGKYIINAAALRFIPKERLQEEGYADMLLLFRLK